MRLNRIKIREICDRHGISVAEMLQEAGVSRNAFYSMARKETVLPRSVEMVAEELGVPVSAILDETVTPSERIRSLAGEARRIAAGCNEADFDNIRHSLLLLDEKPLDRLRRALRRGRQFNLRQS